MSGYNYEELIQSALQNENFLKYNIEIQGQTGKGDGYMGKITFVKVIGTTATEEKTLDLVVKTSSQIPRLRQQIPIGMMFLKEIYMYEEVVPAFRQFQKQSLLPKCYFTKVLDDGEVLILEDLKPRGFDVWDRQRPMTFDHIELVLRAFAKWHALSLVMRRKQPEKFKELIDKNNINMWSYHSKKSGLFPVLHRFFETVRSVWKDDPEVAQIRFSEGEIESIFTEKIYEEPDHHVIYHGDSWTNNFLFKSEHGKPVDVCIIDFQLSGFASPVLDLAVFIYTCVDTNKYPNVKDLLQIYYDSVSQNLLQYDCDPSEVFSFDVLLQHWKKFSCYGIILGMFLLKFSLVESHEAPDLSETAAEGKEFLDQLDFETVNAEIYHGRGRDNILHYVRNL